MAKEKRDRSLMPHTGAWLRKWNVPIGRKVNNPPRRANTVRELAVVEVCAHRGAELTPEERDQWRLGHVRTFYRCDAGITLNRRDVPGVVCPCAGCGPRCPSYVPEEK